MTSAGGEPRIDVVQIGAHSLLGFLAAVGLAAAGGVIAAGAARGGPDPLPALLADDWDDLARAQVADQVKALGSAACLTLSGYAGLPDPRAREHAVRAMADAGCAAEEQYRPFYNDGAPWVADAVLDAVARRHLSAAWPYVTAHLADRRRLVSGAGAFTIEESAHRVLRRLTAQPIPFSPTLSEAARDHAAARWRAFFAAHGDESPEAWMTSGLAACRDALAGTDTAARLAALQTLALVGERGDGVLRDALLRAPGEIEATLRCEPDEPPRVGDTVPCTLAIRNRSTRRIALALGPAALSVAPTAPPAPGPEPHGRAASAPKAHGKEAGRATPAPAPAPAAAAAPARIAIPPDCFVDLLPGGVSNLPLTAGPVANAGRYDLRAAVPDWSASLPPENPHQTAQIEALLTLRFEQ